MLLNDLVGFGLFLGYFVLTGLPAILIKVCFNISFEVIRKVYHLIIVMSIFPLMELFSAWYMAVLAALMLALLLYPVLAWAERSTLYKRIAVEREDGEFKRSLIIVQISIAMLIFIFWGLMGKDWRYIAVVAVMAWGFGDAAAALVGKSYGRRRIRHPRVEGAKTYEGTLAMFCVSGVAALIVLQVYTGQPWYMSLVISTAVALVSAVVELFSNRGMDTLTVPISAAVTTLFLLMIFSFMGI